jgi:hypothetical protein
VLHGEGQWAPYLPQRIEPEEPLWLLVWSILTCSTNNMLIDVKMIGAAEEL